jgi:hypothetical protein
MKLAKILGLVKKEEKKVYSEVDNSACIILNIPHEIRRRIHKYTNKMESDVPILQIMTNFL